MQRDDFEQLELGTKASANSGDSVSRTLVKVSRGKFRKCVPTDLYTAGGTESTGHLFNPGFDPLADD